LTEAIDPVIRIDPPSLNSGNAFCTPAAGRRFDQPIATCALSKAT